MQSVSTPGDAVAHGEIIDAATLQQRLAQKRPTFVLDVRPTSEYEEWHIPGSVHVDAYDALKRGEPDVLAGLVLPDDRPIVTVCGAGRVSLTAAEQLRSAGMQAVSLEGGMKAWSLAFNTAPVPLAGSPADVVQVRRTGKGCLSYVVGSGGEAAVIDASLPPEVYVEIAAERGWRITKVLDTHLHADHLSRSHQLARETGAELLLPEEERLSFEYDPLRDGDVLTVGSSRLQALRTPGHTDDSTCYLLGGAALFTGDTLFTDGVGRPDLKANTGEARRRAGALYDSLQRLLREVPDEAVVLPGHAGRPIPFDEIPIGERLGAVRGSLDMLAVSRPQFVERVLSRVPPPPSNYEQIAALNETAGIADDFLDLEAGANRCAVS